MATPRKAWFRVADAVVYEGWTDNEIASFIRLAAHLNTRWAREGRSTAEAGQTLLGPADVALITGARRRDVAEKRLERLAHVLKMSIERRGDFFYLNWPNWPIFQALKTEDGDENVPKSPPTPTRHAPAPATSTSKHLISPTKSPLGTPDGAPLEGEKLELVSLSDDPPGGFDILHAEPDRPHRPHRPHSTDSTDSTDIEAEVFAEVRRLAGTFHHDRKPRSWRLTKQRRARMRAIAKEFGPTAPVDSFQGFVSYHTLGNRWPEQRANLNPETVWRPSNVAKYLEQFSDGEAPGDVQAPQRPQNHGERISEFNRESAREAFRQMTGGAMDDLDSLIAIPGGKHDRR